MPFTDRRHCWTSFATAVLLILVAPACTDGGSITEIGRIGDDFIGVAILNECSQPLITGVGESEDEAREEYPESASSPIIRGSAANIGLVENSASRVVERFFLAYGLDEVDPLNVTEFPVVELRESQPQLTFESDCQSLTPRSAAVPQIPQE